MSVGNLQEYWCEPPQIFFLLSFSPHKWVRHSGRTRWLRPSRDGTTGKEEVVAAALRSSRRSPRSPSRSSSSSSPAPTSSSTAARWSPSAGRASGCVAPFLFSVIEFSVCKYEHNYHMSLLTSALSGGLIGSLVLLRTTQAMIAIRIPSTTTL